MQGIASQIRFSQNFHDIRNFCQNKQNLTKESCEIGKKAKLLVTCNQAKAYERRLRQMLHTPWPMQSYQRPDVGVVFQHFI